MFRQFEKRWCWIVLYFVTAGLFPLGSVLYQFGGNHGLLIAQTYPDLFIFPICLGVFIPLFIARPFSKAIAERRKILIGVWVFLALAVTCYEVFGGRYGAIWQ